MSCIKSRYIWILIALVTAIISPVRGHTSANGNETRYTYNAAGQKLRVVHNTAKPNITNTFGMEPAGLTSTQILSFDVTDYLLGGSLVVQNNMTKMLLFDGGYAKAERINSTAYGYTLFYYNQDHLGNIREVMNASGSTTHSVSYLDNGNIYQKTGPGIYSYLSSHPHAVTNVTNPLSIISSDTQTATYTPFGKVSSLSDNGYTLTFTYGPDEQRWKTVLQSSGNTVRTTLYADGYERITQNGQTRHFYYLDGGVIYILNDGANSGTFYYTFTDHLGSITRIYNKNRVKVFSAEYDAWGKQTVTLDTLSTFGFHRGYTGHEMLPEFGLINMNGRLYDPVLGRFLSPDNYVQLPDFSQSFNRYSYCLNNPLKYTDPSGELFGIDDFLVIAAMVYIGGMQANMSHCMNNGSNPFNPFAWNWKSFGTYLGMAEGGLNGAGMAGLKVFSLNVPGIITNGTLHAAGNVVLNGITNWAEGQGFFENWEWSAFSGFIEGSIGGYYTSKAKGKNYWWGGDVAYNRSPWSLINTDKPDEIIEMLPALGGSERLNDCVPTTLYEIEQVKGGNRSYNDYLNSTNYAEMGVKLKPIDYESILHSNINSEIIDITKQSWNIFDAGFMRNVKRDGGVISVLFANPGHADNVRSLRVFYNDPLKNTITFRQKLFNANRVQFNIKNSPPKIFWIK